MSTHAAAAAALRRDARAEARTLLDRLLSAHPDDVEALQMLGALERREGRPEAALEALERACRLDPDHGPAHANRAGVLLSVGRAEDAASAYARSVGLLPGHPRPLLGLARALRACQRHGEAAEAATDALSLDPENAAAARERGLARLAGGDRGGAIDLSTAARRGDAEATGALGRLALAGGDPRGAVAWLLAAGPAGADALADALFLLSPDALSELPAERLDAALAGLLADPAIDPARIEAAVRLRVLCASGGTTDGLLAHPLTGPWLTRALVTDTEAEQLLRRARADVLLGRVGAERRWSAVAALASQAWRSEYAWAVTDRERDALAALRPGHRTTGGPSIPDGPRSRILHALYAPLPADAQSCCDDSEAGRALSGLVREQLDTVAIERALAARIPTLGGVAGPTSEQVRALYEEHPYPRVVHVPSATEARCFRDVVAALLPALGDAARLLPDAPRVLVVGGGTGQQPLSVARRWSDSHVLAVDLSRASLARAARLAAAHGVTNVAFAQADLLALEGLDATFDVVDCIGVLHHLAVPFAGARALVRAMAPGALLRLGVYTRRARTEVDAGRALLGIAPAGGPDVAVPHLDADALRSFRARVQALPTGHPAWPLMASPDFASLTGLRDLVFHPCEHRFSPVEVGGLLESVGLEPLGLQHARPEPAARYAARWPDDPHQADLTRWDALEDAHPRTFAGMLVVWARKRVR